MAVPPPPVTGSSAAWLRIVNVTDVYKLDNFPSLRTLVNAVKRDAAARGGTVRTVLPGDFLAPYLLSSVDKGIGMVNMLNAVPVDFVCWGNHEDDLEHRFVMQRVRDFKGIWLNSNMLDYEACSEEGLQHESAVIEVKSRDGAHTRRVGLMAVLSHEPSLYRKNAFGGATITDPYEAMAKYKKILEQEHGVDACVPLCHLYVPQDMVTCERFNFPAVISGHDHHVVNEVFHGTRLVKAGADAESAVILDLWWEDADGAAEVKVDAHVVSVKEFEPDAALQERVRKAYSVLEHLRHTQLAVVPQRFRPLSSCGSRERVCTAGTYLWSMLRDALNTDDVDESSVDCVLISGGNVRGGKLYADDANLTLEDLKSELQETLDLIVVSMPGSVLAQGVYESQHCGPNPGFMQCDDSVQYDEEGRVHLIDGKEVDATRMYRVGTTLWDVQAGSAAAWVEYFKTADTTKLRALELPIFATLISHLAKSLWKTVWAMIDANHDGRLSEEELRAVDRDGDGRVSKADLVAVMRKLGFEVDDEELSFVDCVMSVAGDRDHDGYLDREDLGVGPTNVNE